MKISNQYRRERNAAYDKKRAADKHWRAWYSRPEWKQLRQLRLRVDPQCCKCDAKATVVDHIEAHKGQWRLFASFSNTASMCKRCHDSTKQSAERLGYSTELDAMGYAIDPRHPSNRGN